MGLSKTSLWIAKIMVSLIKIRASPVGFSPCHPASPRDPLEACIQSTVNNLEVVLPGALLGDNALDSTLPF